MPPSLAPLIKAHPRLGVRLAPSWMTTRPTGRLHQHRSDGGSGAREIAQTAKDAGDLSYQPGGGPSPPVIWTRSSSP